MIPSDFILLSAAAIGIAILLGSSFRRSPAPAPPPPQETTRWRRFRVGPAALHGALAAPAYVVSEEPSGLKLVAAGRRDPQARKIKVSSMDGKIKVEIARAWSLFRRAFKVLLAGKELLRLTVAREQLSIRFPEGSTGFSLAGSTVAREYEIRKGGKLVATVSWQEPPEPKEDREDYVLEVLKDEDAVPLIALALGIEVAMA